MAGVLAVPDRPQVNVRGLDPMRTCARCQQRYDWRKSPSSCLKMTYCGSMCERADLGFTLEGLMTAALERGGSN